MQNDKKLKGRDLINIGICGAIYFVTLFRLEYRVREVPEKPDLSEIPDTYPTSLARRQG